MALIGKEWDHITWGGALSEDPNESENLEFSDSQGFIAPEEIVPSAPPLEILPFLPLAEELIPIVC